MGPQTRSGAAGSMLLSVVVPTLDEEAAIAAALAAARAELATGDELIVADGGSTDRTVAIARSCGALVVESVRGRGRQMNAGAAAAGGELLLFLHADTRLPAGWREGLESVLAAPEVCWGRFDIEFDQGGWLLQLIARLISARSRLFRSATGDQAIFVRSADFHAVGGYRHAHLFEDVDLARTLRARGRMGIPPGRAVTSARRWRNRGVWATTLRMWTLKTLYLCGVPVERLERHYGEER